MEVRAGYKQTDVGVIPSDWNLTHIGDLNPFVTSGSRGWARFYAESGDLFLRITNLSRSTIYPILDDVRLVSLKLNTAERARTELQNGDLLISITADIGIVGFVSARIPKPAFINQHIALVRFDSSEINSQFASYFLASANPQRLFRAMTDAGAKAGMNLTTVKQLFLVLPPTMSEQQAIATALSDADALIESLEQLLTKKRHLKQGAMQELLTGKRRLPGFSGKWVERRIADIASPSSEKNSEGKNLTVLTCSKHLGFVDSLGYFRNQVFSRDTSGYKLIRRGQIGYPSNHIEEGSIGLQARYDVALVSPIYVVFSVAEGVESYFLHRLLKLDTYRQKFESATSSSIDRRGSLRWPTFSEIRVTLPPLEEQTAIATVLSDMDAELAALEAKLAKARHLKQGMMQVLLTGQIRLI